jgi:exodeoxyribonuclease V gamma subunit
VQSLLDEAAREPLFAGAAPSRHPVAIDCAIAGFRVQGELARVWRTPDALCVLDIFPDKDEEDFTFKERIGLFLEWALVRLADPHVTDPEGGVPVRILLLTSSVERPWQASLNAWDDAFMDARRRGDADTIATLLGGLRERVGGLLAFWSAAQVQPPWYFPKTSWIAATDPREQKALDAWQGGTNAKGERHYEPGYAALLARDARFEPDHADFESLCDTAHELLALIRLRVESAT